MNHCRKVILLWIAMVVGLTLSCRKPTEPQFQRNPNLKLLISHSEDKRSCFNPVWSPINKKVYYLLAWANIPETFLNHGGQLYNVNIDGSSAGLLNADWYGSLAISPNNSLIAATTGGVLNGRELILLDTLGNVLDTITTTVPTVLDVEFNYDGTKLYYYVQDGNQNGFYRIDIDGSNEELVMSYQYPYGFLGFDLDENDSILIEPEGLVFPQVNDSAHQYIVGAVTFFDVKEGTDHLKIVDRITNEEIVLNAKPFDYNPAFCHPFWNPGGDKIVFGVAENYGISSGYSYFELWILENVLE